MDKYTPTTEQVREAYQYTDDGLDFKRAAEQRGEAFDRWLADHDAAVWDQGFDAGEKDAWDVDVTNEKHVCTPNPYRGDNR